MIDRRGKLEEEDEWEGMREGESDQVAERKECDSDRVEHDTVHEPLIVCVLTWGQGAVNT